MSGFFTEGEIGNTLAEAEGTALIPSTTGEVLGAQFNQSLAENPASRLVRWIGRNTEAYPITMSAEEANNEYGIQGRLTFTEPVSRTTARDLNDFHQRSAIREDVIARRQGGIGTGAVARFGVGLGAAILDPLNIASAFLPGVREARVASMLGGAAAGVGGRLAVRAIAGGSQGLVGAAALEPLNYWLSQQDKDDYTMGDVLTNLAFGTVLGGVMHSGIGLVRDRRAGLPAWSPEMHEAALRHTLASVAEGRPVEAAAAMEFTAVRTAREELRSWMGSTTRVAREAEDALTATESRAAAVSVAEERVTALRTEIDTLRAEIADARARSPGEDRITQERIAEIDAELGGTIPAARRADLERERTMLTEGGNPETDLDVARAAAEVQGLSAAAGRAGRDAGLAQAQLARAQAALRRAESVLSARSDALTARETLVQELTARTLRRLAGRLGATLSQEEAADMASRIARARPDDARATMNAVLDDIANQAPAGPYLPGETITLPGAAVMERMDRMMAARESVAETRLADSARGAADPRDMAAERDAARMRETAPKVEGASVVDDLAEAQRQTQEIGDAIKAADKSFADAEVAAGRKPPEPDPELVAADELAKEGESLGRAFEAAAACAIGGRR